MRAVRQFALVVFTALCIGCGDPGTSPPPAGFKPEQPAPTILRFNISMHANGVVGDPGPPYSLTVTAVNTGGEMAGPVSGGGLLGVYRTNGSVLELLMGAPGWVDIYSFAGFTEDGTVFGTGHKDVGPPYGIVNRVFRWLPDGNVVDLGSPMSCGPSVAAPLAGSRMRSAENGVVFAVGAWPDGCSGDARSHVVRWAGTGWVDVIGSSEGASILSVSENGQFAVLLADQVVYLYSAASALQLIGLPPATGFGNVDVNNSAAIAGSDGAGTSYWRWVATTGITTFAYGNANIFLNNVGQIAFRGTPGPGGAQLYLRETDGSVKHLSPAHLPHGPLTTLTNGNIHGMNDAGQVFGTACAAAAGVSCPPFVYTDGAVLLLDTFGRPDGVAVGVSAAGDVLGMVIDGGRSLPTRWTQPYKPVPPVPSPFVATGVSPSQIDLAWGNVSTLETTYRLQRRMSDGVGAFGIFQNLPQRPADATGYSNTGLAEGVYQYRIRACNATGCSPYATSRQIAAMTVPIPAGPITGIAEASSNDLTWSDSNNEADFQLQRSYRVGSASFSPFAEIARPARGVTSYNDSDVEVGFYRYRVRACNRAGCSAFATSATIRRR